MNKKEFCKFGEKVEEYLKECDDFNTAFQIVTNGHSVCTVGDKLLVELIDVVSNIMEDENQLISAFIFEKPLEIYITEEENENEREIVINTYEELYDYLREKINEQF